MEILRKRAEEDKTKLNETKEELEALQEAEVEKPVTVSIFQAGIRLIIQKLEEVQLSADKNDLQSGSVNEDEKKRKKAKIKLQSLKNM